MREAKYLTKMSSMEKCGLSIEEIIGRVSDAKEKLMEAVPELIWHGFDRNATIEQFSKEPA